MKKIESWEEVKDISTLAKVKTVEEMIPVPAKNQMNNNQPRIWEEQYKIIEECLKMDGTIEEACILAWISVPSYYHHRNTNPDFARRMDIARQFPKMIARAAIQRRIRQWDSKTAMEFIKLRDRRYKPEAVEEEWEKVKAPVVQFISVASNEWADQSKNDIQNDIKQNSASDTYVNFSEEEIESPRENDEQVSRNLDSMSFSSD
jgi:hypothetical protein